MGGSHHSCQLTAHVVNHSRSNMSYHAQIKGGYPSIRHNELRDFTASLLLETCHGVAVEPSLQPITSERFVHATANTQDGAP